MLLGARYVSAFQSSGLSRAVATKRGMRMPGALARAFPPSVGSSLARMATTSSDVQAPCRPPSVIGEDGQLATQYARVFGLFSFNIHPNILLVIWVMIWECWDELVRAHSIHCAC
jgi:hypothetical protein